MRLTQLLESMIRLPDNIVSDIMEFVYAYVISFMGEVTGDTHNAHDLLAMTDVTVKHPDLFKRLKFNHTDKVLMSATIGLGTYNFKYNFPQEEDKKLVIRLVDSFENYYGGYDDDTNTLTLNLHALKMLLASQDLKISFIEYTLHEIENTIEHELMHFVQHKTFGKIDPRQVTSYEPKDRSAEEYAKYASSSVELLPNIKSEYNSFTNKVNFLSKAVMVNNNDRAQLLRYYVGDDSARVHRFEEFLDDFDSIFFRQLKKHDRDKWKKAVKTILQIYQENN